MMTVTTQKIDSWFDRTYRLTGSDIKSLMRKHKRTIRDLSEEMNITMKRIRVVRYADDVVLVGHAALDWIEHITGQLPARARAAYRQRARTYYE